MNKNFLIVSFYTKGFYKEVASLYLIPSLQKYELPYYIEEVNSFKDWNKNTNIKAEFCKKMLNKFPNKKLIWLDVDAQIVRYPSFFDKECDMGVVYLSWKRWFFYRKDVEDKKELISNVIIFKKHPIVEKIIDMWIEGTKKDPYTWEQKHLEKAVSKYKDELNLLILPESYSYLATLPNGELPKANIEPVIKQYQISRKTKKRKDLL